MALVVLQMGVLGVAGTLLLAAGALRRAETVERAVARAEGVLDSLETAGVVTDGSAPFRGGEVRWWVGDSGAVVVRATGPASEPVLEVHSVIAWW